MRVTVTWPTTYLSHLDAMAVPQKPVEHVGNDPAVDDLRCVSIKKAGQNLASPVWMLDLGVAKRTGPCGP